MSNVAVGTLFNSSAGNQRMVQTTITGGTSDYVNGTGYSFTPNQLGLSSFNGQVPHVSSNSAAGYISQSTLSSGNLIVKVYWPTGGGGTGAATATVSPGTLAVPAGATPVTSTSANPTVTGTGTLNPGPGVEVASSTDLHLVSFNVIAFGS